MRLLNTLLNYNTASGAAEHWAGRYQLVFVPNVTERSFFSPYDVTVGCVTSPYGLEYHGGLVRITIDEHVEKAIQMVMGSAARSRSTIFVSRDEDDPATSAFEVEGERSVSCKVGSGAAFADCLYCFYSLLSLYLPDYHYLTSSPSPSPFPSLYMSPIRG